MTLCTKMQDFFFFFFACGSSPQCELLVKVVRLLGLRGPWRRQVCRDTDCLCGRSYAPLRVLFFEPPVAGDEKAFLAGLSL